MDEAEDVLEDRLLDRLLEPVERDVTAIARDGRDPEQGRPPEGRETPGAPGPEGPAREGAEPCVEFERASVGGARREDAEGEVEVAEVDRGGPGRFRLINEGVLPRAERPFRLAPR